MATQILRPKAVSTERIRRRLRPAKHAPPNKEALALIQGVVRRSKSVEDAVTAVRAVNSAWAKVSSATHDATELLVTILDLSDNVEEALATLSLIHISEPTRPYSIS